MPDYQVLITTPASREYGEVTQLRYRLFLQEHGVPVERILEADEKEDGSILITLVRGNQMIGCGRLTPLGEEGQISHMAVDIPWQGQGYGAAILNLLLEKARETGLKKLFMNARVTARGFYQKSGFTPVGELFPSALTGLPHIKMEKML